MTIRGGIKRSRWCVARLVLLIVFITRRLRPLERIRSRRRVSILSMVLTLIRRGGAVLVRLIIGSGIRMIMVPGLRRLLRMLCIWSSVSGRRVGLMICFVIGSLYLSIRRSGFIGTIISGCIFIRRCTF